MAEEQNEYMQDLLQKEFALKKKQLDSIHNHPDWQDNAQLVMEEEVLQPVTEQLEGQINKKSS